MRWRRAQEPVSAGTVLARWAETEAEDAGQVLARVLAAARWQQVAGATIAAHTAVLAFEDGLLTVGVPNRAWVSRLERERSHLLAALAAAPHGERIRRLQLVVAPPDRIARYRAAAEHAGAPPRTTPRGDPAAPPLREQDAAALAPLAADEDDELRALFESWMRHTQRRRHGRS